MADGIDRLALRSSSFSIIANDCWGAEVYRALRLPYRTPFVGMMLYGPCFIEMLRDLRAALSRPLRFTEETRYSEAADRRKTNWYPLGLLGDIELHFLHERSCEVAEQKWERRVQRIDWKNLYFKFADGKDAITAEHLAEFDGMPLENKVALVGRPYAGLSSTVCVRRYECDGAAMYRLAQPEFDVVDWLNGGSGRSLKTRQRLRSYRALEL